jgi:hypothetical protein
MLSEEWLRVIQEDRQREIQAAERVREAQAAQRGENRLWTWLRGAPEAAAAPLAAQAQAGRPATDPSA